MVLAPRCLIATTQTWPSTGTIPALLAQAGVEVASFSPGPLGLSGHLVKRFRCSRFPERAAAALREHLATAAYDWVVIADEVLLEALLANGGSTRETWLPIDPADAAAAELLLSKHAFVERAAALGIETPASRFVRSPLEAQAAADELGYPVVLKGDHGFGGSQVRACSDAPSVDLASRELLAFNARLVVQRRLHGRRVSTCALYDHGALVAYKTYLAECSYPDEQSASTVHEFFHHPAVERTARALGRATGFFGMAGIDFMLDGDGSLYALEINPRPTIGFAGAAENRAFFAPAIRRLLRGESAPETAVYNAAGSMQSYFPAYLIYLARNGDGRDAQARTRLVACLREARLRDARLAVWEVSRFLYDEAAKRLPRLHATAQRVRGIDRASRAPAVASQIRPDGLLR